MKRIRVKQIVKEATLKTVEATLGLLRSGGLKVRLVQVDCVGEFKDKGSGRVFW